MHILIVTPAPKGSRAGNRVTASRWATFLRSLGHRVRIAEEYSHQPCDLLIALHARKSAAAVRTFRAVHPRRPVVLALTGTDVYRDIHRSRTARESLDVADRLVVLQPQTVQQLNASQREKTRVIYQSVEPLRNPPPPLKSVFEVSVIGHLRPVKDPFRAAWAARELPAASRIRVTHVGAALSRDMERRALREMQRNPRYRWLGEQPRWQARRFLARSRVMVLSSELEGGANVVSEAIAAGVPVLSSKIAGSVGLLGEDYAGYFPLKDTQALSDLLDRCENDPSFYRCLQDQCRRRRELVQPERERAAWQRLLAEFEECFRPPR